MSEAEDKKEQDIEQNTEQKDPFEGLEEPPMALEEGNFPDSDDPLWPPIRQSLRDIYDPEIPVNIYELGLIYSVQLADEEDGVRDVKVIMTLTSPGCPVAQEMPEWVRDGILPIKGTGQVDVEIVWDPIWDPSKMAETAKMQLNMYT